MDFKASLRINKS